MTTLSVDTRREPALGDQPKRVLGLGTSAWRWMAVACALLGISGAIRFWRDYQFRTTAVEASVCPFPLKELPTELGTWRALEGSDAQLDPQIARIAGSTDHIIRTYMDEKTAERVTVLVLYGLAPNVGPHVPEVCFPATGHSLYRTAAERTFQLPELGLEGKFRSACYGRRTGASMQYVEVCHGFLFDGRWLPEIQSFWKQFRYHPATFKIQLQRELSGIPNEESADEVLTESLYKLIVAEVSKQVHLGKPDGARVAMTGAESAVSTVAAGSKSAVVEAAAKRP